MLSTMDTSSPEKDSGVMYWQCKGKRTLQCKADAWEELKPAILHHSSTTETKNYLDYMESTWIYSRIYPVEMWNHHESVDFEIFNAILLYVSIMQ